MNTMNDSEGGFLMMRLGFVMNCQTRNGREMKERMEWWNTNCPQARMQQQLGARKVKAWELGAGSGNGRLWFNLTVKVKVKVRVRSADIDSSKADAPRSDSWMLMLMLSYLHLARSLILQSNTALNLEKFEWIPVEHLIYIIYVYNSITCGRLMLPAI